MDSVQSKVYSEQRKRHETKELAEFFFYSRVSQKYSSHKFPRGRKSSTIGRQSRGLTVWRGYRIESAVFNDSPGNSAK